MVAREAISNDEGLGRPSEALTETKKFEKVLDFLKISINLE